MMATPEQREILLKKLAEETPKQKKKGRKVKSTGKSKGKSKDRYKGLNKDDFEITSGEEDEVEEPEEPENKPLRTPKSVTKRLFQLQEAQMVPGSAVKDVRQGVSRDGLTIYPLPGTNKKPHQAKRPTIERTRSRGRGGRGAVRRLDMRGAKRGAKRGARGKK